MLDLFEDHYAHQSKFYDWYAAGMIAVMCIAVALIPLTL